MLRQNDDKANGYVLYKVDEESAPLTSPRPGRKNWCSVVHEGLSKCCWILYKYSILSCITSCRHFSQHFQRDNPDHIEMNDFYDQSLKKAVVEDEKPTTEAIKKIDKLMKDKINHHFENHLQKWKNRKRFPFKVILDILLVALVTAQVVLFAEENTNIPKFLIQSQKAFQLHFTQSKCDHKLVNELYKVEDVYSQITHIVNTYYNISEIVGAYSHIDENGIELTTAPVLRMEIYYYAIACGANNEVETFPYNLSNLTWQTDVFHQTSKSNVDDETCCNRTNSSRCTLKFCDCSVEEQIKCYFNESNFSRVKSIKFYFGLHTFLRDHVLESKTRATVHAKFCISITLKNDQYSSMTVEVDMGEPNFRRYCTEFREMTILDIVIIVLLILSSIAHCASFIRTYKLAKDLKLHFSAFHLQRLRWTDELFVLFNKWYIFILFTNVLVFVAVVLKIIFDYQENISVTLEEVVRVLLGTGVLLLWCSLFGLLTYLDSLNVLFIAIRLAIPTVLRFAVCIFIIFIAFVISGWLVLGTYHSKFADFEVSALTLYCILSGDDIFATFDEIVSSEQAYLIKLFSNIYLILFIFIFLYAVISLFIGIFSQAYDLLSENWKNYSRGYLRDWAEGVRENDPTESYPFPVPPERNPATNADNIQESMDASSKTDETKFVADGIPTIQIVGPSDEQPHSNTSPHRIVISPPLSNRRCSVLTTAKLQVAQPPAATTDEVNEARYRLRESFLLSYNDDRGKIN